MSRDRYRGGAGWRKFGVHLLAFAAVGLPNISRLRAACNFAVIIFTGEVRSGPARLAGGGRHRIDRDRRTNRVAPPRIDEGHNVFRAVQRRH